MKKVTLLFLFPLLFLGKSFGQCTPVDCSASLPAYGGVCDTVLILGYVNQAYYDYESFVITDNCFDAGVIDPAQAGNNIKITNVDNFTFTALPAGLTGATNAASYSNGSVGCAAVSGTPTEAGFFRFSIDFLADVQLCGFFPIPVNDNAANYLVELEILPNAGFTGLGTSYCTDDAAVALAVTGTTGGIFSGPGVSGAMFDPAAAGVGTHMITYTVSAQQGAAVGVSTNSSSMTVMVTDSKTIYVDQSATGTNDGSSWANAYTDLQSALTLSAGTCGSKDILIAEGTYVPGINAPNPTSRANSFTVDANATLTGGYPTGGGSADPSAHETILSGDVDGDGSLAGNSFHVIRAAGLQGNIVETAFVGLTITGGNADNENSFARYRGGGIYTSYVNCSVDNCNITGNTAGLGGGIFATLSDISIDNSKFTGNTAERGAALYHSNETNMFIRKSRITDNTATNRCAIEINNSLYTRIENSVIANNASGNANAIAFIATNRDQTCDIINSTILGESKNKSLLSMQIGFGDELNVNISNSIIAHQTQTFFRNIALFNNGILNFNLDNCYISGSALTVPANSVGTNNIVQTATMYADLAGDLMLNANYSTSNCSPVVNAGNNSFVSLLFDFNDGPTDITGGTNDRIALSIVDIGAYEKQFACPSARENVAQITPGISIYPNPVNDIVNIQTELEDFSVQIHDILGRTVVSISNETSININTLPRGTYIMNIFQNGKLKGTEKLMKH